MPKANCTFRKSDVKRAYAAATDAGMKVGRLEIDPSGKISLIPAGDTAKQPEAGSELDQELAELEARLG